MAGPDWPAGPSISPISAAGPTLPCLPRPKALTLKCPDRISGPDGSSDEQEGRVLSAAPRNDRDKCGRSSSVSI